IVARGYEPRARGLHRRGAVTDLLYVLDSHNFRAADVVPELRFLRQTLPVRPGALDGAAGPDGRPLAAGEHRQKVLDPHRAQIARNLARFRITPCEERGLYCARPDNASVDHSLDLEILHVRELPRYLGRHVPSRNGSADDGVVLWSFQRRLGIELQIQVAAANELRVAPALARGGGRN